MNQNGKRKATQWDFKHTVPFDYWIIQGKHTQNTKLLVQKIWPIIKPLLSNAQYGFTKGELVYPMTYAKKKTFNATKHKI